MFIIVLIHLLGGLITLWIYCHNGMMKFAVNHGDGIRWANPSDIVFRCFAGWEIILLIFLFTFIDSKINEYFRKRYGEEKCQ